MSGDTDFNGLVAHHPRFYIRGMLLRKDHEDKAPEFYAVAGAECEFIFHLDGTSDPIHAANAAAGLRLNSETVAEYLGFFCCFLHGADGQFRIAGEAKLIEESDAGFRLTAVLRYGDEMFNTEFLVRRDGDVEMVEDESLGMVN